MVRGNRVGQVYKIRSELVCTESRLLDGVVCVVADSLGEAVMLQGARGPRTSLRKIWGSWNKGRARRLAPCKSDPWPIHSTYAPESILILELAKI